MIDPREFLAAVVDPALAALSELSERNMATDEARVLMLAIALQETMLEHRRQIGQDGKPIRHLARGWWQFEKGGGVQGVLTHSASATLAARVCAELEIEPADAATVHEALAWHDHLAACFARLLLFTDNNPLPRIGDEDAAWAYYERNWRPGKPRRDKWAKVYPQAVAAVAKPAPGVAVAAVPTRGILRVKGSKPVEVVLPKMARSWQTGEFWLNVGSTLGTVLILLSPLLDPYMAQVAENPALASIPLAGAALFAARQWLKRERVRIAGEIAAKGEV